MADKIKLTHPRLPGREFWAAPEAVANWQRKGWQPATRTSPPPAPTPTATVPPPAAAPTPEED